MTIFIPKDSPYYYVDFKDKEGTKRRLSLKTKSPTDAKKKALEIISDFNNQLTLGDNNKSKEVILLSRLLKEVFNDRWSLCKDRVNFLSRSKILIETFGDRIISDISNKDITILRSSLQSKKLAASTINRYLSLLSAALKDAREVYEYLDFVPVIKLKKEAEGRLRFISKEEETKLIEKAPRQEIANLIIVLVDTGMRRSEALELQINDCDFQSDLISIWVQKGSRPRSIPMTKRVKEVLWRITKEGKEKPFTMTTNSAKAGWRSIERRLKAEEWFNDVTYHVLRHTCASRLVQAGVSLLVVKEILGHESITTTQRYAHLRQDDLREAIKHLN